MANDTPLSAKELGELKQLYQDLRKIEIPDMTAFVKAIGGMESARRDLNQMRLEFHNINSEVNDLSKLLSEVVAKLSSSGTFINQSRKGFKDLSDIASRLKYDQDGIDRLNKKQLESLDKKIEKSRIILTNSLKAHEEDYAKIIADLAAAVDSREILNLTKKKTLLEAIHTATRDALEDEKGDWFLLNEELQKRIVFEKKTNDLLGISGALVKGLDTTLNKLGLGGLGNIDEIKERMQEVADEAARAGKFGFGGKLNVLKEGAFEAFKQLGTQINDPVLIFTTLFEIANKADKQVTELAKSLSLSKGQAEGIREQFTEFNREIGNTSVTTDRLLKSFTQLTSQLGFNVPITRDLLKEFTTLTNNIGISEESAAGLSKLTIASGKNARIITTEALGTAQALESQYGIQLDNRKVLEEVGKVSGQLLSNFKANPGAISEAVVQAQLLGTTLAQTRKQGEYLLNFEGSIQSELKAELITGQQLNLERARAAALMGNQVDLAKELANQNIDFHKFSQMNVVAQKSLAEALGLSSDELSDQLLKQQMLHKSKAEVIALDGEAAAQRLEALAAQDKFNNAVEKLQGLLANLIDGPLGIVLDMVADIAGNTFLMKTAMGALAAMSLNRLIVGLIGMIAPLIIGAEAAATLASSLTLGVGALAIAGGIYAIMSAMKNSGPDVHDGVIGKGGKILYTASEGAIRLNDNDTIIAGTNLFGGSSNSATDLTPMIKAINEVKYSVDKLLSKDTNVYLDSKKVGNGLVQGSGKLA